MVNHDLFILSSDQPLRASDAGNKAVALQQAACGGLPVPPWFVVLPTAFYSAMASPQREEFKASREPAKVKYAVQRLQVSPRFVEELSEAADALAKSDPRPFFAVRASVMAGYGGDACSTELKPILYVRPDGLMQRVIEMWQQAYREELLFARWEAGRQIAISPPAVIVQRMVHSDVSGIAYGSDPASGRRGVSVISAVYGLRTSVGSGECKPDTYEVSRSGEIVQREIAQKQAMHVLDDAESLGYRTKMVMPSQQPLAALTDAQCIALADLTWRVAAIFFRPQEIEWAFEAGKLYLLQTQPVLGLPVRADPDGVELQWDRRNIAREYPGRSTPLTYTVARWMMRGAYQELCRALGVAESVIRGRDDLFDSLVGYIGGAIYFNTTRLREMLRILPQPSWHRDQLAHSLGLMETPADEWQSNASEDDVLHLDVINAGKMWTTLQARVSSYEAARRDFEKRLAASLDLGDMPLERLRPDELAMVLRRIQRDVIDRWDAPAMNEALAAIAFDLLGQLTRNWCDDVRGELQRALVMDIEELPGSDAAHRIAEMAMLVAKSPELTAAFVEGPGSVLDAAMLDDRSAALRWLIEEYLDRYGGMSPDGLKIEVSALRENPLPLIREIGRIAAGPSGASGLLPNPLLLPTRAVYAPDIQAAERANERVAALLAGTSVRRAVFSHVRSLARERIRDRENDTFTRIRIVGRVRKVLIELGRRLYALDLINSPRHIYYLEFDEVLELIEGNASSSDLRSLVGIRWKEFKDRQDRTEPSDTLTTHGVPYIGSQA